MGEIQGHLHISRRFGSGHVLVAVAAAAAWLALGLGGTAAANTTFCPPGAGPGECNGDLGFATDFADARLYVADSGNQRIDVFEITDSGGAFQFSFGANLVAPRQIAVDNYNASSSYHDIYVFDDFKVRKYDPNGKELLSWGKTGTEFCEFNDSSDPIAVGPEGNVFVADNIGSGSERIARVQEYSPEGTCLSETILTEGATRISGLAIDANKDAYVSIEGAKGELRKYELEKPKTKLCSLDEGIENRALTVDQNGDIVAAQRAVGVDGSGYRVIARYAPSCERLRRWGYDELVSRPSLGIATLESALGDVIVQQEDATIKYLAEPPAGPVIVPSSVKRVSLGSTKATIRAEVNPEGKATTLKVDYVTQAQFETSGFDEAVSSNPVVLPGTPDFELHLATVLIGCADPLNEAESDACLEPETDYQVRVIAENTDGHGNSPVIGTPFATASILEILGAWATDVGSGSASLSAEVNPLGLPTVGFFEYVEETAYEEDLKNGGDGFERARKAPAEGLLDFGESEAPTIKTIAVSGLAPSTSYRYRLIAKDPLFEKASAVHALKTFMPTGAAIDQCGTTAFRLGNSAFLSDCRAYEMVSPLDKNNGDIVALREVSNPVPAVLSQASTSGEKLGYGSYRSFGDAESAPYTTQYIAVRGSDEWKTHGIVPRRNRTVLGVVTTNDTEIKAFSPDLCEAFLRTVAEPPLDHNGVSGYVNVYRRIDQQCGGPSFESITNLVPSHQTPFEYAPLEYQGATADGAIALYAANDNLTEEAPNNPDGKLQAYIHGPGSVTRFLCYLPDGSAFSGGCSAGSAISASGQTKANLLQNAISTDGSRVFWSASMALGKIGLGQIYLRVNPLAEASEIQSNMCTEAIKACTISVSEEAEAEAGTTSSRFWAAAADGSQAILTTGTDLFRVGVKGEGVSLSTDTTKIAGQVKGVAAVSEDAAYVYFVSEEGLDEAHVGDLNLFVNHEGNTEFIGALAPIDAVADSSLFPNVTAVEPWRHNTKVSADGQHLAFMSVRPLTGYDNVDANSGEADAEVFLYDAGADELICGSCNPSGSRPSGSNVGSVKPRWVAAQILGWENSHYDARWVSDDGSRLYFQSFDALAVRDTNGRQDVYQWEAPGSGSCSSASPTYSSVNEGCVDLISSGQSNRDSEFTDASPSGNDVFFTTQSSLVPQDYGLIDVYDARVGGGLPSPPPAPSPCEAEACRSPPAPPQDPTPASSSYQGPGDVKEGTKKPRKCPKGRHKVKKHGKVRCVKNKRAKRGKKG
jgi:hypothetical protein